MSNLGHAPWRVRGAVLTLANVSQAIRLLPELAQEHCAHRGDDT
jgi:hypothetical protein